MKSLFIRAAGISYTTTEALLTMATTAPLRYSFSGEGLRSFFFLRNVLIPCGVALGLMVVPSPVVLAAMIIGGQAHFVLAYLYQWRAGKMNRGYLLLAAALVASAALYFFLSAEALPLFFAVSLFFSTHFAYDEVALHDEQYSLSRFTTIAGFVALFMALTIDMVYGAPHLVLLVAGFVVLGALVRIVRRAPLPSRSEYYLWFLSLLVTLMTLGIIPVAYGAITTFIIILHFFNWMIGYGVRVFPLPAVRKRYWNDTVIIIGFCTLAYGAFALWASPLFSLFFAVSSYYAWAIAHITLSFFLTLRERFS